MRLFVEYGYDSVTMEQIARTAGVSRRTLYRHFPTKDRILLDLTAEAITMWDETVEELPPDTPARQVIEHAVRRIAADLDADGDQLRMAWSILDSVPALEPGLLANPMWTERFVGLLTDPGRGPVVELPLALTIAGAHLGAFDATMLHWATGADRRTVVEAVDVVLDHLEPIWPPPLVRRPR